MFAIKCHHWKSLWTVLLLCQQLSAQDYNVLQKDGSYEFSYDTPDSYHRAQANRNNVVRGQFGGRNPETGAIDSTDYTAGPRGFRPRGKNIHRKYDLNQSGPRPIGSRDDPYYDPTEDPSYNFKVRTRTYIRDEAANRIGNVNGRYSFIDDVGEKHNVEYIAGKDTGFHVKTPFPDSNPRAYGPLYFRGRGRPIPRGRTSIQRGLDGSYRFITAGPDQRRTETSDSAGNVRGSYTYLDDKGVQHSVHYIAGPEIGYRVLKNVKGPHLPTIFPFGRPEIIPADFYDYVDKTGDVFDTAASGPIKPIGGTSSRPTQGKPDFATPEDLSGADIFEKRPGGVYSGKGRPEYGSGGAEKPAYGGSGYGGGGSDYSEGNRRSERPFYGGKDKDGIFGTTTSRPGFKRPTSRPYGGGRPFNRPSYEDDGLEDVGDVFGDTVPSSTTRPREGSFDDGGYRPDVDNGSYKPDLDGSTSKPFVDVDDGSYTSDGSYTPDGSYKSDGSYTPIKSDSSGSYKSEGEGTSTTQRSSFDFGDGDNFSNSGSTTVRPSYSSSITQKSTISTFRAGGSTIQPTGFSTGQRPGLSRHKPSYEDDVDFGSDDINDDFGLFGDSSSTGSSSSSRPEVVNIGIRPVGRPSKPSEDRMFGGKPGAGRPPSQRPTGDRTLSGRPSSGTSSRRPSNRKPSGRPSNKPSSEIPSDKDYTQGTYVTNLGDTTFSVPPGVSVRAHVQAIDLLPFGSKFPSPSEQFKADLISSSREENYTAEASNLNSISNYSNATTDSNTKV